MRTECQRTRKDLPRYLRGHLFTSSRKRIARHLQECVVCRSEFEALKRVEETKLILQDINASDDIIGRVREGVSWLGMLKKVLYRPLWIAGILLIAGGVLYYIVTPRQLDIEIERIVKTAPSSTQSEMKSGTSATLSAAPTKSVEPAVQPAASAPPAIPAREALVVTLTPINDQAAVQHINDVMRGHGALRAMAFTDVQREISGSLTAKELMTFFNRIETSARVSFSRKRFESFPADQPIPFVMKLKAAPKQVEAPVHSSPKATVQPPSQPSAQPVSQPLPQPAQAQPESAPSSSSVP